MKSQTFEQAVSIQSELDNLYPQLKNITMYIKSTESKPEIHPMELNIAAGYRLIVPEVLRAHIIYSIQSEFTSRISELENQFAEL